MKDHIFELRRKVLSPECYWCRWEMLYGGQKHCDLVTKCEIVNWCWRAYTTPTIRDICTCTFAVLFSVYIFRVWLLLRNFPCAYTSLYVSQSLTICFQRSLKYSRNMSLSCILYCWQLKTTTWQSVTGPCRPSTSGWKGAFVKFCCRHYIYNWLNINLQLKSRNIQVTCWETSQLQFFMHTRVLYFKLSKELT